MSINPKTLVLRRQVETTSFRSLQIKSVTGNDGHYSPNSSDIRRSFGGSRSCYADLAALEVAQDRLIAGHDANIVRMKTGWFLGVDGKMRFEIDDSKARFAQSVFFEGKVYPSRFINDARDRGQTAGVGYLGDILDHPALFDAYPGLKLIYVEARIRDSVESGGFDGQKIVVQAPTQEALMAVILHEVQHALQIFEGFAVGGNVEIARRAEFDRLRTKLNGLNASIEKNVRECIKTPKSDPVTYEVRRAHHKLLVTRRDELNDRLRAIQYDNAPAHNAYTRLAGEVEARNVMSRLHMSSEDRQRVEPQFTADVQPQDMLIIFDVDLVSIARERVR